MKKAAKILGIGAAVAAIVGTVWWGFYLLWNFVAVALGLPELTFWQSVGLLLLLGWLSNMFKSKGDRK